MGRSWEAVLSCSCLQDLLEEEGTCRPSLALLPVVAGEGAWLVRLVAFVEPVAAESFVPGASVTTGVSVALPSASEPVLGYSSRRVLEGVELLLVRARDREHIPSLGTGLVQGLVV